MSIHGLIEQRLREAGYETPHAKAIIWIAKASSECELAKKWWTGEVGLFSTANIEVLWESVRKIAARYALTFLPVFTTALGKDLSPLEIAVVLDKVALLNGSVSS